MGNFGLFNPALSQLSPQNTNNLLKSYNQPMNQNSAAAVASALLHTNTNLVDSMGSRSKRERPQSMNKLTSFREQNRTRHVPGAPQVQQPAMNASKSPAGLSNVQMNAMNRVGVNQNNLNSSTLASGTDSPSLSQPDRAAQPPAQSPAYVSRPDIAVHTREYVRTGEPSAPPRRWTDKEDTLLRAAVKKHKERNWKAISKEVPGRNHVQCLQRWRKALDPNVVKGHWTAEEDQNLLILVAENPKNWGHVARGINGRTAKQCRERYHNHLDPSIKKGDWSEQEDKIIIEQQKALGNKWAEISKFLPGRTENSVKIRWKSIQRQLQGGYNARRTRRPGPRFAVPANTVSTT